MTVVPADERDCRKAVGKVFARYAHASVSLGTNGIDDLMVEALQLLTAEVNTVGDISEEPHPRIGQDLVEDPGHRLDGLVIGRNPVAYQAERGGEAVEYINGEGDVAPPEEILNGIQPCRAGTDDGNS
jgi:hypothetical protein